MISDQFVKFLKISIIMLLLFAGTHLLGQTPPTTTTQAADNITSSSAQFHALVNANGKSTTVTFEYGTNSNNLDSSIAGTPDTVTGSTNTSVSADVYELSANTTYYFRVVAVNADGTTTATSLNFITLGDPPAAITDAATNIGADSARLNGTVSPRGAATTVSFEYGTTTAYGTEIPYDSGTPLNGALGATAVYVDLSGLADNTLYHYRVKAVSANGTTYGSDVTFVIGTAGSAPTAVTTAATSISTMGAVLNGTVNASDQETTVEFEYGESVEYGTTVTAAPSPVTGTTDTAVSAVLGELTPNTTYHYRVNAANAHSTVNGSDMTFTTAAEAPTATTLAATSVTATAATLNGTVNANGVSTSVTFQYGTTIAYGTTVTATPSSVTGTSDTAVSRNLSGLINGVTYHYRVCAVSSGGTTYGSDMTFTAGISTPTVTTSAATGIAATSATFNGTVNANGGSTVVTFEYGTSTSYGRTATAGQSPVTGSTTTAVSATPTDLLPLTLYHYRAVGVNGSGTVYGSDMTFTTLGAPTAVTDVATSVTTGSAVLNGKVNANNTSATVLFEYGTSSGVYGSTVAASPGTVTGNTDTAVTATLTGLTQDQTYYYRVKATNANGTGTGNELSFTCSSSAAPTVVTDAAARVMQTTARLHATVTANNAPTTVVFQYYALGGAFGDNPDVPALQGTLDGSSPTTVYADVSGLTVNTIYFFRAVATNTNGTTNGSSNNLVTTIAPGLQTLAPTNVTATSATLNGWAHANGDPDVVLSFQLGTPTPSRTYAASPEHVTGNNEVYATYEVTGLTPSTTYQYTILGSATSAGSASGGILSFTTAAAETAPTAVTTAASAVTAVTATLNGTVNANNSSTAVTFEYGLATATYNVTVTAAQSPVTGSADTGVNVALTNLLPNTTYYYRVVANNTGNTVNGSELTFTTSGVAPTVTTVSPTDLTASTVTLNGRVNANSESTDVTFEYGTTNAYGSSVNASPFNLTDNNNTAVSAALSGLTANTTYHYRVVAVNSFGTTNGEDMTFYTGTSAPTATTQAAGSVTDSSAVLNGTVSANNDDTAVTFEYGPDTAYGAVEPATPATVTGANVSVTAALSGLSPSTTYHYRVVGTNAGGTTNGADMTFTTTAAGIPMVTTTAATGVTAVAANSGGTVTNEGSASVTARGICYSQSPTPTIADTVVNSGTGAGAFTAALSGLTPATTYYVRAFATNGYGTGYGDDATFTTAAADVPTVTTTAISDITTATATSGGTVTDEGTSGVTARGVCWSTAPNPTVAGNRTTDGSGAGAFTSYLINLAENTTYYVRAYATNPYGTGYGDNLSFTTTSSAIPSVTTAAISNITDTGATGGGTVTNEGSTAVTARGICWSTSANPTLADANTLDGSGAGSFTSTLAGLTANTTYYVRAYASNTAGTGYGAQVSFTTTGGTTPPTSAITVAITAPDNAETVSDTVAITADASLTPGDAAAQAVGTVISKVAFYIDGKMTAEDTASPYQTSWDTTSAANGSHTIKAVAYDDAGNSAYDEITVTVYNDGGTVNPPGPPVLSTTPASMTFSAQEDGPVSEAQKLYISNTGESTLTWNTSFTSGWLACAPANGTDAGVVIVSVDPTGLAAGTYTDVITVTSNDGTAAIPVSLTVLPLGSTGALPFGEFSTPISGAAVAGSIPVTGWALDDLGVDHVKIYRNPVSGESGMVYIGDAFFVEGARPDVAAAFPTYPHNEKAGWGYMLLTNALPDGGNGTYTLYAVVTDLEGNSVNLGAKTIYCDNANAVKPFGAIDTPEQGGSAAGASFFNWGWALTPQPNTIPTDGSTIYAWVDGVPLGHPSYNHYRHDIAELFPGYNNSNGAVGYFLLDTTAYTNGVHSIAWSVKDNAGNIDGIGSRYFTIENTGTKLRRKAADGTQRIGQEDAVSLLLPGHSEQTVKAAGHIRLQVAHRDQFKALNGYMEYEGKRSPLPVGSTLDQTDGCFYWAPGPGYTGAYNLVFEILAHTGTKEIKTVTITVK